MLPAYVIIPFRLLGKCLDWAMTTYVQFYTRSSQLLYKLSLCRIAAVSLAHKQHELLLRYVDTSQSGSVLTDLQL